MPKENIKELRTKILQGFDLAYSSLLAVNQKADLIISEKVKSLELKLENCQSENVLAKIMCYINACFI